MKNIKIIICDTFFLSLIFLFSFFLISPYFKGEYLDIGYEDWMVQAYRIKLLALEGFTSWNHAWANGIDIWKAYQFLPHLFTLVVQSLFQVSIPKAMIYTTIILFVTLRVFIYTTLRFLAFSPFMAFFCTIVSFGIAQYWGGVSDFSILFGFTIFPIILYLWIKFYEGKIAYLFPYLLGISFYIHPVLGYTSFGLMVFGLLFSNQRIISWKTLIQIIIFFIASSLFWYPVLVKTSFLYSNPYLGNTFFLRQVIVNYGNFGLSLFILFCFPIGLFSFFLSSKGKKWVNILFFFSFIYFFFIFLAVKYQLPDLLTKLQFTRGTALVGISMLYSLAIVVDKIWKAKYLLVKVIIFILLIPIIVESITVIDRYAPKATNNIPDPVSAYSNKSINDGRIWVSTIGASSYFSPVSYRFPYSYMGHLDSNIISSRLPQLMIYKSYKDGLSDSNLYRITDYFKLTGVKYAFLTEDSFLSKSFINKDSERRYKDLGLVRSYNSLFHVFEAPFEPINGVVLAKRYANLTSFPSKVDISKLEDQIVIDRHVREFTKAIYDIDNLRLSVSYPTQDTIRIFVPLEKPSRIIYLNESFDNEWRGVFNDRPVVIEPTGPNFMKITLPADDGGTIILKHSFPSYVVYGTWLILLTGAEVLFLPLIKKFVKYL